MAAILSLRSVDFAYPDPRTVLEGLDLDLEDGECLGLVGCNGSGKTTLFLILAGVLRPGGGTVEILGKPGGDPDLRGRIGVVFQNSDDQLFSTTVADDVAFGPRNLGLDSKAATERVTEALAQVGLEGFEERVPHHLSGGEKRKVAIACTLAMHPELLLFDEPTSDLDPRSRREFMELIGELPGAKIIASHDFEMLAEISDRVAILHHGRVDATGQPLELLADSARMEAVGLDTTPGLRALARMAEDGNDPFG